MNVEGIISVILITNWVNEAQIKPICEDPANCIEAHEIVIQQRQQVVSETVMDFTFEGKPIRLTLKREMVESEGVRKRFINSSSKVRRDPFRKNRMKTLTIDKPPPEPAEETQVETPPVEETPQPEPEPTR